MNYDLNEAMNTEQLRSIIAAQQADLERRGRAVQRIRFMLALALAFCWMPFWRYREPH